MQLRMDIDQVEQPFEYTMSFVTTSLTTVYSVSGQDLGEDDVPKVLSTLSQTSDVTSVKCVPTHIPCVRLRLT